MAYLEREKASNLAYVKYNAVEGAADLPTIMFLGGFRSDMEGTKALYLEEKCKERGQNFIRFDYSGHGASEGKFEEGCIGDWAADALDIFDQLTQGPVMLVGSSMGGWISLLIGLKRSKRVHSIIGLAAAPDFTKIMEERMDDEQKALLNSQGYFELPNDYSDDPYIITKRLIDDGRDQCLLNKAIDITVPVRLIQGKKDVDVQWETANKIKDCLVSDDVEVILLDDADHRLSSPDELQCLNETVEALL